jgi:phage-related baseplate assembly protein
MTFVAEPFGLFVDDLLSGLTGAVVREGFRFLPEEAPFRLDPPAPVLRGTVRVHGIAGGAHAVFRAGTDYQVSEDGIVQWQVEADLTPKAGANVPDLGSRFWVNYEHQRLFEAAPRLTDRNPGSVTRLLAETFAREYAVLSGQLEAVYRAGFVETATGRDLDQLALLLGVTRATAAAAGGSVVFSRRTPAAADIALPAGTRVSTKDAPPVLFETTEQRTLRRGELSAEAPIRALVPGRAGIVPAGAIGVLHRPLLGIEAVANPQATAFASGAEDDAALRARLSRALETAGKATTGALVGALSGIEGVREKDIRVAEDPIARPGLIEIDVALPPQEGGQARLDAIAQRALELIEETRPAGVRVLARLAAPVRPGGSAPPPPGGAPGEGPEPVRIVAGEALFFPVDITAVLVPGALGLSAAEQAALRSAGEGVVRSFVDEAGLGEALVYNRLVAQLMMIEGVQDVAVEMSPAGDSGPKRKNILPAKPAARASIGALSIRVGGVLVVLDATLRIRLKGAGLLGAPEAQRDAARAEAEAQLRDGLARLSPEADDSGPRTITPDALRALLIRSDSYDVEELHYQASYEDAGLRVLVRDPALPVTGLERFWLGTVALVSETGT